MYIHYNENKKKTDLGDAVNKKNSIEWINKLDFFIFLKQIKYYLKPNP